MLVGTHHAPIQHVQRPIEGTRFIGLALIWTAAVFSTIGLAPSFPILLALAAVAGRAGRRVIVDAVNAGDLATATAAHQQLEPLVRAVMTHVPGTVAVKYILHGLGRISSPRVRLPLVGPEDSEAAQIEDEIALVGEIPGVDLSNFRPDRNAAAGGALPKVAGTTR